MIRRAARATINRTAVAAVLASAALATAGRPASIAEAASPPSADDPSDRALQSLRAAVESLRASFPAAYPGEAFLRRLDAFDRRSAGASADPSEQSALRALQREMLVDANPLLKSKTILFVKRNAYGSVHYYDDHDNGIGRAGMGGNLCALSLQDGAVREVAPQLAGGLFDRYDLSFDGRRIVFGYCKSKTEGLRLWEIRADGTALRSITSQPPDEDRPGARQTHDFHPCYLPDGGILFTSTRAKQTVLCGDWLTVPNLYRIEPDGTRLRRLTRGTLNELCPTVMNDGRILYNRWEYVFKSLFNVQPLWSLYPDGGRSEEIYGNNIGQPGVFVQGRAVPGRDDLIVCTGACHEQMAVGPILLIDLRRDKRSPEAMRSLTPEVEARGRHHRYFFRNGTYARDKAGPVFCDPYPLSDKFFLVSHNQDKPIPDKTAYGITLIDTFGNQAPVYRDPGISCWQPMVLEPRAAPPVLPSVATPAQDTATGTPPWGTLFVQDVHHGLDGIKPGAVKFLRILEQAPRPWDALEKAAPDDGGGGSPRIILNKNTHIWVSVLHGVVPVRGDGSAFFTVPADRNLFLQALDENHMSVQTMRTIIHLKPGESRSCIGCHESRQESPSHRFVSAAALRHPPDRPIPQPGDARASRPISYMTDVQPVFDAHCVRCHGGPIPQGKLDLSGELTTYFNRSYEELLGKRLVHAINEWSESAAEVPPLSPYARGAQASRLIHVLRQGHYDVKLSTADFVRLVTSVDVNLQYYGSYYGKRNLKYKGAPDFRPVPTLESACVPASASLVSEGHRPPNGPLYRKD